MFWSAVVLGLAGSFHCMAMCGPIAFALPIGGSSRFKAIFQISLYHLGRIGTYAFIGGIFGFMGRGLYLAGFQQRLSILMGIIMIAAVITPKSFFNRFYFSNKIYKIIGLLKSKLGFYLRKNSLGSLFLIGFFNGFLPCGLVYMALIGSISTGKVIDGSFYMALFGLGTIPIMSLAFAFGNFLNLGLRNKIQKAIPVFVIIIGILFILRGLGLGIPYISPPDAKLKVTGNPMECSNTEKNKKNENENNFEINHRRF
jgi:sulfite exporter TauE/SafE